MSDFIEINKLICGYLGSFLLDEITFQIKKGVFTGIIGPNGSGKTTLFKGLSGELSIVSGELTIEGSKLTELHPRMQAQKIAVVTQNMEDVDMTVEDYVLMGRMPYRKMFQLFESEQDHNIADKYMEMVGVFEMKGKMMSELSGGEQQLCAIARALTQEPDLLLLDEPTSHLDISHQVQILNLIQQLNEEMSLTVLMIIHDLNLAGEYCDYLIMMNEGKVHIKGTPEEVLNYQHIEDVYKTVVITQENPLSKKPAIFLVSDKVLNQAKK